MSRRRKTGLEFALVALALISWPAATTEAANHADAAAVSADEASQHRGQAYAHLMRSLFSARRGEFRQATSEIRRAIALQPEDPDVYVEGAKLMDWMGRRSGAEQLAREALDVQPGFAPALRLLADMAAKRALSERPERQEINAALRAYEELARHEPLDADALMKFAHIRVLSGDLAGAIETASSLVEQRPGDVQATGMLFRLLVRAREETEALQVLLEFLALHPDEESMLQEAERLAAKLGAWEMVARLLEVDGENAVVGPAQALRGEALLRLSRVEDAILALEAALAADTKDERLRLSLVLAYRRTGRLADAAVLSRSLVQDYPDQPDVLLILAETLDRQRDVEQALETYGRCLELLRDRPGDDGTSMRDGIRRRMAALQLAIEEPEHAISLLDGLEQPDEPEAIELEARAALQLRDWAAARTAARRLRVAGHPGTAALVEVEALVRTRRWAKAEDRAGEAIDELGTFARVSIAHTYGEVGRAEAGERMLREWVERQATDADAQFELGRFLYDQEQMEPAERALREAFRLDPDHAPALNFLGYSLAERSVRLDEALELVLRALAIDPWDGAYLDSLGWVYFQMGRYAEAREPLERAAREYPQDPIILEHLGDLYQRLGEGQLAVSAWTRALETGPEDADSLRTKIAGEHSGGRPVR